MIKNYILDTNVPLHDPQSLLNFSRETVRHFVIPIELIEKIRPLQAGVERLLAQRTADPFGVTLRAWGQRLAWRQAARILDTFRP